MDDTIVKAFGVLIASVGAIAGLFFLLKKVADKVKNPAGSNAMKVVSRLPLQNKTSLFIVEVSGKKILIGATDRNVNAIADLTDSDKNIKVDEQLFGAQHETPVIQNTDKSVKPEIENKSLSFKEFLKTSFKRYN